MLVASQTCVSAPGPISPGAPGPPIFVLTQPGSTELLIDVRPPASDRRGEHRVEELGVGVRLVAVPAPVLPLQVREAWIT